MSAALALALASSVCYGLGLTLTQLGLRDMSPAAGATISIPSLTVLFILLAPFALAGETPDWTAVSIFTAVGLLFPPRRRWSRSRPTAGWGR